MKAQKDSDLVAMDRRHFLKLIGLGGGAVLLSSCAPAGTSTPTGAAGVATGTPAAGANGAKTTLTFWTPGGSAEWCAGFTTIAKDFQKVDPNIVVGNAQCYTGNQAFNEVLLATVAAGNPPDCTIVWSSPVSFAVHGAAVALDNMMSTSKYSEAANWPSNVLASCQFKGQTYGLPVTAGSYAIFYNQEMFEAKGLSSAREDFPKTWDDLRRISKEFTHWNGDTLETAGYIPWSNPADPGGSAVELAIWSALNGSQLFDAENLKYTLDSEENIAMMQYAVDWLKEEYKGNIVAVRASGNWSGGNPDAQGRSPNFQAGKQAMLTNGAWFTGDMYGADMKFTRWEVAPFPVGPSGTHTVTGYWPNWLMIPKGSKHVDQAFEYMDYMSGVGIEAWFAITPDTPANKLVPTDLVPKRLIDERGLDFATNATNFFRNQLDVATPMWNSPVQDFGNDQIGNAVDQILSLKATPKDALGEAQKQCQAELDRVLSGG